MIDSAPAMTASPPTEIAQHDAVANSLAEVPLVGVVRTTSAAEAERQARLFVHGGVRMIEITFTVPDAPELVRRLAAERGDGAWRIGMGTVTDADRARRAVAAGAEFVVTPNVSAEVARLVRDAGAYLIVGALTPTEIVAAREIGADLVKVFPLPPVGGPAYLRAVRGPLGDVPMLAAGGFGPEEIPAYRAAGAVAFGIGAPMLAADDAGSRALIRRAVELARAEAPR